MDMGNLEQTGPIPETQSHLDILLPELPSQYELLDQITSGAMGQVFKARNRYTGAYVAIKIIRAESTRNATAIQRFFLEAKAANLLKHPNICRVLDFGVSGNGTPYLIMEWVEGINLEKMVEADGELDVFDVLAMSRQIAQALAHAHQKRIIHRDLKPQNIMVNFNAVNQIEVQLIDFGIAKMMGEADLTSTMTRVGMAVGTPAYMSPEQARGVAVDCRTDIYSLGCVMYYALTGGPPFTGGTVKQLMEKHLYEMPPDIPIVLDVPDALKAIVFKAMSKSLDKRYATMEDLVFDLDKLIRPQVSVENKVVIKTTPETSLAWIWWFVIGFIGVAGIRFAWESIAVLSEANTQTNTQKIEKIAHHHKVIYKHK
jgi:serine/threonine-protein kinase